MNSEIFKNVSYKNDVDKDNKSRLAANVVNEWMQSSLVKQLIELNLFSPHIIKTVLFKRYDDFHHPYLSFAQLYDDVAEYNSQSTDK